MPNNNIYYIWGAGLFGERAFYHFNGWLNIGGFIDSNSEKWGQKYKGQNIISFDEFLEIKSNNDNIKIIIAMIIGYENVLEKLKNKGIYDYYLYSDCPQELFSPNLNHIFESYVINKIKENKNYAILGNNIYSVLVNEWVKNITGKYADIIKSIDDYECDKYDEILITAKTLGNEIKRKEIINLFSCTNEINAFHNKRLQKFKDCNKGKRCFIVATGPSLLKRDLDKLHKNKEITISMNLINKMFDKTDWRPDYYLAVDFRIHEMLDVDMLDIKNIIVSDSSEMFVKKKHKSNIYINHVVLDISDEDMPEYSDDFSCCSYTGGTVTYSCIQFATYMGIKEIYLLGVDFSGYGAQGGTYEHFYEEKNIKSICYAKQNLLAYQAAKKYADEHGIRIYNATRGGKLEVFERVNFDDLF